MATQAMNYTAQDIVSLMEAMKVIARFISNSNVEVRYNNTGVACADMDKGIIHIPRMGECKYEDLMKLRTFTYHEAGHIIETNLRQSDLPTNKAIFKIWNALEDVRMESVLKRKHESCRKVLEWATDYFNRTNGAELSKGTIKAPLWEAVTALMFTANGRVPSWAFTCDVAKWYYETAHAKFMQVSSCRNGKDTIKLAEEIYELLKDKIEEEKEKKEEEKKNKEKKNKQKQKQKKQQQQSGDDGDPQPQGNEDGDDDESQGSSGSGSGDGEEDEQEGSGGGDEESEGDESDEGDEKSSGDGDEESEDADGGKSNNKGNQKSNESQSDSAAQGDTDNDEEDVSAEDQISRDLEGGHDLIDEQLVKEIKDAFKESDNEYTSITDRDTFEVASNAIECKRLYAERKKIVGGVIMGMSRNLEQALRSLSRTRKHSHLEHGKIDMRRMVAIGKSLSKRVFYNLEQGEAMNTAVEIVIDESGSMSTCYLAMQLVTIALGETMSHLNIPFEIFGTTTMGGYPTPALDGFTRTNPIKYKIYKAFGESWMSVAPRITNLRSYNNNIDGEAIKFCASRLETRKEKRRVILSLSDGEPCGGQGKDDELAQNIINVCKQCRRKKIEVYGFGVGTRAPEQYYGKDYFVYLENATSMGQEFFRRFAAIVTKGRFTV